MPVNVISPTGKKLAIPDEKLDAAVKAGYKKEVGLGGTLADVAMAPIRTGIETIRGASSLGERTIKGIGRILTPKAYEETLGFAAPEETGAEQLIPESIITPKTTAGKVAKFGTDLAMFLAPSGMIYKAEKAAGLAAQATKVGKMAPKAAELFTRATIESGVTAGMTAVQQGKVDEGTGVAAIIGGAVPFVGAGLKAGGKTIAKKFGSEAMIDRAMGMTPSQKNTLNQIATKMDLKKNKMYRNFEDFVLQKGLKGSRHEMVDQAETLLKNTIKYKQGIVEKIKGNFKNHHSQLINILKKEFSHPGLEDTFNKLDELSQLKKLNSVQLNKVRSIADDFLSVKRAYMDSTPLATKGIQKLVDPLRTILEKADKTGSIVKSNTDIRLLQKLIGEDAFLTKAAEKTGGIVTGGEILGGGAGYALSGIMPHVGVPLGAYSLGHAMMRNPTLTSHLAYLFKGLAERGGKIKMNNLTLDYALKRIFGEDAVLINEAKERIMKNPKMMDDIAKQFESEAANVGSRKTNLVRKRFPIPNAPKQGWSDIKTKKSFVDNMKEHNKNVQDAIKQSDKDLGMTKKPKIPKKESFNQAGQTAQTTGKVESKEFHSTIDLMKKQRSDKVGFLTPYKIKDYSKMNNYLLDNKRGGYAIKPDGDLVSLFSLDKGNGIKLMQDAIKNGAKKLDAFEGYLTKEFYPKFNFKEVKRVKWDDKYAPKNWNYEKYKKPDIIYMELI